MAFWVFLGVFFWVFAILKVFAARCYQEGRDEVTMRDREGGREGGG